MTSSAREPTFSSDPDEVPDEELVACFQAGSVSAFNELVRRYDCSLYKYLVSLVGEHEAYDLIQETFIIAYQKLPHIEILVSFKAWLYRVATNLAKDHWRHANLIHWLPWKEHREFCADGCIFITGPEQQVEEVDLLNKVMAKVRDLLINHFTPLGCSNWLTLGVQTG